MKDYFRNPLNLSSAERKGIIFLIILILALTGINTYVKKSHPSPRAGKKEQWDTLWVFFQQQLTRSSDSAVSHHEFPVKEVTYSPELFHFDPNTVSHTDLKRLGFNKRLIRTLVSYRQHGGRFRYKEDLKKIYGLSDVFYRQLAPYVVIERSSGSSQPAAMQKDMLSTAVPKDINLADSAALERLPGIGPVLSQRIVRYRSLLGGFYTTNQLIEVYGLPDSLIAVINRYFFADTATLRKINLNTATAYELQLHPYIDKYTAQGIISYRRKVKAITCIEELYVNGILSDEQFNKVKKYLSI